MKNLSVTPFMAGTLPATDNVSQARLKSVTQRRFLMKGGFLFLLTSIVFMVLAAVTGNDYYLRLGSEALIFAGLALSLDLVFGFCGLLSLGHALFFGFGAYVSGMFLMHVSNSILLDLLVAIVMGGLFALALSYIVLRSAGVYFALLTFALAEIARKTVHNTPQVGGSDGLIGIPVAELHFVVGRLEFDDPAIFFGTVLIALSLCYALSYWLLFESRFGAVLHAVKSNSERSGMLGYNTKVYQRTLYVMSAAMATLFGALYPMLRGFISPELFGFDVSTTALVSVITGGVNTLLGALIGAVGLTFAKNVIASLTEFHVIIIGAVFVAVVLLRPRGLIGGMFFKDHNEYKGGIGR